MDTLPSNRSTITTWVAVMCCYQTTSGLDLSLEGGVQHPGIWYRLHKARATLNLGGCAPPSASPPSIDPDAVEPHSISETSNEEDDDALLEEEEKYRK